MKLQDVPKGRQFHLGKGIWLTHGLNEAKHIASWVTGSFDPETQVEFLAVSVELWGTDKCIGCNAACRLRTIEARGKYAKGVSICIPCAIAG